MSRLRTFILPCSALVASLSLPGCEIIDPILRAASALDPTAAPAKPGDAGTAKPASAPAGSSTPAPTEARNAPPPVSAPSAASANATAETRADDRVVFSDGVLRRVDVSRRDGMVFYDAGNAVIDRYKGDFEILDALRIGKHTVVASVDRRLRELFVVLDGGDAEPVPPLRWPAGLAVEALCLYRDADAQLYLFALGDVGLGAQWLIGDGERLLARPALLRTLALPPNTTHCAVDATRDALFVSEEDIGVWHYPAAAEAPLRRRPVDLVAPFGKLPASPAGLAVQADELRVLSPDTADISRYVQTASTPEWTLAARHSLNKLDEPEQLHRVDGSAGTVLIGDKSGWHRAELPPLSGADARAAASSSAVTRLVSVHATVETEPLSALGDAADDPAIWIHPSAPDRSRVLGTDKQNGLEVYDLAGKRLQTLAVGRLNNVDLRPGFALGNTIIDLAVASHRDRNSLQLFRIDPATGEVSNLGELPTSLDAIYGLCLGKTPAGEFAVFVNDKDGRVLHVVLDAPDGTPRAREVRRFALASQPEGCVVDDAAQRLFIGEEDVGVWAVDARADAAAQPVNIATVGNGLVADVEGLAVYDGRYLIVSSQGDDSYAVYDAAPPYASRGRFRIALNVERGIDGVSETDGLDVTHHPLGAGKSRGMLVVQDGRNRLPGAPQNFKYVPWDAIASALKLP